jgi:ubiquinone/menaquinone biosynthesis C-methylase UbiE
MNIKDYKPQKRFSDLTEKYARYRPDYPQKIIDVLKEDYFLTAGSVLADIGSGTGIFSKLLLVNGYKVFGVEPNQEMRKFAENTLSNFHRFESIQGLAEKTRLADNSVDAITSAQAFHWFDIKPALTEFHRILKRNGIIVLIWNERIADNNEFQMRYDELLLKYCREYKYINHKNFTHEKIESIFPGRIIDKHQLENRQVFDLESLIGRLESSSYCPREDDSSYMPLMKSVGDLFKKYQHDGKIEIEYDCVMYCIN